VGNQPDATTCRARTTERPPVISAFQNGIPIAICATAHRKKPGFVDWSFENPGLKRDDRPQPIAHEDDDSGGADAAKSSRKADLAFQRAMRRAIKQGLEHPPMIGVFRDARPLHAPRLFEPVPCSSGCTSPAQECAEIASDIE